MGGESRIGVWNTFQIFFESVIGVAAVSQAQAVARNECWGSGGEGLRL